MYVFLFFLFFYIEFFFSMLQFWVFSTLKNNCLMFKTNLKQWFLNMPSTECRTSEIKVAVNFCPKSTQARYLRRACISLKGLTALSRRVHTINRTPRGPSYPSARSHDKLSHTRRSNVAVATPPKNDRKSILQL